MEESIVIQLYQFIANYTAYRHLYGHLIICLAWREGTNGGSSPQVWGTHFGSRIFGDRLQGFQSL